MAATDYNLEQRGLPSNAEAERSLLGAILLDNTLYTEAGAALKPDDFFLDAHRRIYSRILELSDANRPVDLVTLSEELSRHKELEAVGGMAYLSSLTDGTPRRTSIEHYVRIVRDKSLMRGVIRAANTIMQTALDQADSAADVLDRAEAEIFSLSENRNQQDLVPVKQVAIESFGGNLDKLYERGRRITGLETHYSDLDELTSGLQRKELIIIAARPSMGKTAFALNIAENCAVRDNKVVAIFSLEMGREALLYRMLCSQSRVDSHKLRTGFLGKEDMGKLRDGLEALMPASIFIDDTPGVSVTEVRAKSRRLKQREGRLDLIVVDYMQLMSASAPGGRRYENRTQEVSAISRGLKAIAKEMDVPLVAISQLSRAPETRGAKDNEPKLSDLRESGAIEQDADVVMFLYRPEYYNPRDPDVDGKAKLIIAKQRNGPTDTVQLAFLRAFTRFETLERSEWMQ
ncbi:MAG: replicative DNA helicase [Candidatus Korobacteraceae bacterium]|jgi:replicative DNA helicase